jgi:hypothetical protein
MKCKNCNCNCHCKSELHSHHYDGDLCTCDNCECKSGNDRAKDSSNENNGGLVIDDTGECESCQ